MNKKKLYETIMTNVKRNLKHSFNESSLYEADDEDLEDAEIEDDDDDEEDDDFEYDTNYGVAVNWCSNNFVMCNEITKFHELEYTDDMDEYDEIFQYFLTDASEDDVEFLTSHFSGLHFAWCEDLGLYVLLVTHYGTSWYYVSCSTDLENAVAKLGQRKDELGRSGKNEDEDIDDMDDLDDMDDEDYEISSRPRRRR